MEGGGIPMLEDVHDASLPVAQSAEADVAGCSSIPVSPRNCKLSSVHPSAANESILLSQMYLSCMSGLNASKPPSPSRAHQ